MKITMTKKDAEGLMTLVNRNNCELAYKIAEAPSKFEFDFYNKQLEDGRKLWSKLFDAQMREVK